MAAIVFEDVSKRFILQQERDRSFQEVAVNVLQRLRRTRRREEFWALRGVNFAVAPGETLGLIGENGSGKSTTLKLISRILEPTAGCVQINGRVSALLELGAGFHPDLTGRENVYLNGALLGFGQREMRAKIEDMIAFSELGRFIDVPVKHYSSGMFMRLGFAIAIHVDPDILLTDEVLAVGDESFQRKCMEKIAELQASGKTILFVSHSMEAIRALCSRVLWLQGGQVQMIGDADQVVDTYLLFVHRKEAEVLEERHHRARAALAVPEAPPADESPAEAGPVCATPKDRWGSGEVRLRDVRFLGPAGQEDFLHRSGDPATIELQYEVRQPTCDPVFGIGIYRQDDLWVYGTNTAIDGLPIAEIAGPGTVRLHLPALDLIAGQYWLAAAVHARDGTPYDFWQRCREFSVYSRVNDSGVYRPAHRWELETEKSP